MTAGVERSNSIHALSSGSVGGGLLNAALIVHASPLETGVDRGVRDSTADQFDDGSLW